MLKEVTEALLAIPVTPKARVSPVSIAEKFGNRWTLVWYSTPTVGKSELFPIGKSGSLPIGSKILCRGSVLR